MTPSQAISCWFHRVLSWETRNFQKIVLKAKTSIYKPIDYPLLYLSLKKQLNNIVNSLQNWHLKIPLFLNIGQRKSTLTCNLIKSKKKIMWIEMKIMRRINLSTHSSKCAFDMPNLDSIISTERLSSSKWIYS